MTTASLIKVGAVFIFAGLAMSGCSANVSSTPNPSPSASIDLPGNMQEQAAETLEFAQTLLGMAQAYAENKIEEAGYEHRMVWKDGESFAVTEDYRPTRINLYIKEGIVDKVEVG